MHSIRSAILVLGLSACGRTDSPNPRPDPSAREGERQRASVGACATDSGGPCPVQVVPLARLLARPEDYDGRRVQVMGFAHFEFEGNGIYLHRDDAEHWLTFSGLWLDGPNRGVANADSLSDHYVLIEGTFDAQNRGHFGMWAGAIVNVTHARRWPSVAPTR